jgi:hypothetical protein
LSPAAAALQAKLAAKKAGQAAPALPGTEQPPANPVVSTEYSALSTGAPPVPEQAEVAAEPPSSGTSGLAAGPGPAVPLPAKTATASAALLAKLAAKKAAAQGVVAPAEAATAVPGTAAAPSLSKSPSAPVAKPGPGKPASGEKAAAAVKEPVEKIPAHSLQRLKGFYVGQARQYLSQPLHSSPLAGEEPAQRLFAQLRGELPVALHGALDEIEQFCAERRQLLHLQRLHWQLHWWLGVHIPASVAVIVLMLIHIVAALRVVPFLN